MKTKKRLKDLRDLPRQGPFKLDPGVRAQLLPHQRQAWDRMAELHADDQSKKAQAAHSPEAAKSVGMGYTGPNLPDKGCKDGHCNRTACQAPLKGRPQFYMDGNHTGGPRLYYCEDCARIFTRDDRHFGDTLRCKPDEDNPPSRFNDRFFNKSVDTSVEAG